MIITSKCCREKTRTIGGTNCADKNQIRLGVRGRRRIEWIYGFVQRERECYLLMAVFSTCSLRLRPYESHRHAVPSKRQGIPDCDVLIHQRGQIEQIAERRHGLDFAILFEAGRRMNY